MKKIPLFLTALLLSAPLLTACRNPDGAAGPAGDKTSLPATEKETAPSPTPEELPAARQKELYAARIETLEDMLSENGSQGQADGTDIFYESIGSLYLFPSSYSGSLRASGRESGVTAFQMSIENTDTEEKEKYDCRLLADGSLWFTWQTENACPNDLPDYIVNEEALRYARADYVYDDGNTDPEEQKRLRLQELEQSLASPAEGKMQEFCQERGRLYKIDRENKIFVDVTESKESCIAAFLQRQLKRLDCQRNVQEDSLKELERHMPEGYHFLWGENAWNAIAACDLNHDGKMDYVAALYPEDCEAAQKYTDGSPYEYSPEYYAAGFWLFLSSGQESYERIPLSDSVEYWSDTLVLTEIAFVDEGILQLEYFTGRSPFCNAQLRFRYDGKKKNFYILASYYRNAFNDSLLIGDVGNYGEVSLFSYFSLEQNYREEIRDSTKNIPLQDGILLEDYSGRFQYRCENRLEQRRINSSIWETENELVQLLAQSRPFAGLKVSLVTDPVFYNRKLVSGQACLYGSGDGIAPFRALVPIMVDRQSGECITVTGLLEKEDFMQIFGLWSGDAVSRGTMTAEECRQCMDMIEKYWEKAGLTEHYFGGKEETLFLQMAPSGVKIGVWMDSDGYEGMHHWIMDKEYFWGTKVWEYLEPYQE